MRQRSWRCAEPEWAAQAVRILVAGDPMKFLREATLADCPESGHSGARPRPPLKEVGACPANGENATMAESLLRSKLHTGARQCTEAVRARWYITAHPCILAHESMAGAFDPGVRGSSPRRPASKWPAARRNRRLARIPQNRRANGGTVGVTGWLFRRAPTPGQRTCKSKPRDAPMKWLSRLFRRGKPQHDGLLAVAVAEEDLVRQAKIPKDVCVSLVSRGSEGEVSARCRRCSTQMSSVQKDELLWFICPLCKGATFSPLPNLRRDLDYASRQGGRFELDLYYLNEDSRRLMPPPDLPPT
jgi:hypothetical protein